jgi:hypothetical protein
MDIPATLPRLFRLLRPGGLFYFTINFDGATLFEPSIEPSLDELVQALYHRTMDERITDGYPSGDSRSGRHLFGHLQAAGAQILAAGASDWVVFPKQDGYPADEAYFLHFIIHTIHGALAGSPSWTRSAWRSAERHASGRALRAGVYRTRWILWEKDERRTTMDDRRLTVTASAVCGPFGEAKQARLGIERIQKPIGACFAPTLRTGAIRRLVHRGQTREGIRRGRFGACTLVSRWRGWRLLTGDCSPATPDIQSAVWGFPVEKRAHVGKRSRFVWPGPDFCS